MRMNEGNIQTGRKNEKQKEKDIKGIVCLSEKIKIYDGYYMQYDKDKKNVLFVTSEMKKH